MTPPATPAGTSNQHKSPLRALALGASLVVIGFLVGYGYQAPGRGQPANPNATPTPQPEAPLVKGLRSSPDGKLLAFTAVYGQPEKAAIFILDTNSGHWHHQESPGGWQDYVTQWSADGKQLLVEREKIPRAAVKDKAGLYSVPVVPGAKGAESRDLVPLTQGLVLDPEKIITGFWAPNGNLIIKTRREPKALYEVRNGEAQLVDRAAVTYGQNRVIKRNGQLEYLVMRDVPNEPMAVALYRVFRGKATQFTVPLQDVIWSYISEDGKQLLVGREAENDDDWEWSLYAIGPDRAREIRTGQIPADLIVVYWSPDGKRVLGIGGKQLWAVDLPSLKARALGNRSNWEADDAGWVGKSTVAAVAANGEIWKVDAVTGKTTKVWRFPNEFWK